MFFAGARSANPLTIFLVIAFTIIPVAGVANQALAIALGPGRRDRRLGIGVLVSVISHTLFFRIRRAAGEAAAAPADVSPEAASWSALQAHAGRHARVRAGADQPGLLHLGRHENGHAGPAGRRHQRAYGRSRAGGIHVDGGTHGDGGLVRPHAAAELVDADAVGRGCIALGRRQAVPDQAHVLSPVVLGQRADDDAHRCWDPPSRIPQNGKDVYTASATRVALFVVVALYAWVTGVGARTLACLEIQSTLSGRWIDGDRARTRSFDGTENSRFAGDYSIASIGRTRIRFTPSIFQNPAYGSESKTIFLPLSVVLHCSDFLPLFAANQLHFECHMLNVVAEALRRVGSQLRFMEKNPDLVVDVQRSLIEVERADEHDFAIDRHRLGVQARFAQAGKPGKPLRLAAS